MGALAIAEDPAQRADLNLQIRFFHECLWPDARHQCLFGDHLAGPFNQCGENIERTAAEPHGLVALEQEPPRRNAPNEMAGSLMARPPGSRFILPILPGGASDGPRPYADLPRHTDIDGTE